MSVWQDPKTKRWKYKFERQKQRYKKEGFATQREAILAEAEKRSWVNAPAQTGAIPSACLEEIILEYLEYCKKRRMATNTVRQKYFVLTSLLSDIGDKPVDKVTKEDIESYLDTRIDSGKSTHNRDLRDIRAMFNWHFGRQAVLFNPANDIYKIGEDLTVRYIPPIQDYTVVKLVASIDEVDFLETIFHAGLRRIEAQRLLWDRDINFGSSSLIAWTRKRKDGALTSKPKAMTKTLRRVLYSRYQKRDKSDPRVFQFDTDFLDHMMRRLCKKAKVQRFTLHALRHLGASSLLTSNAPLPAVQAYLGHERVTTTDIYAHMFPTAIQQAVDILDSVENQDRTDQTGKVEEGIQ
ncbi:MAG: tyrosine-type recombinase/integrase [Deltaproteobacteria bacterium]|nr:tyrosine-type recombinase/integrase [Deltaproteobacteria bacterium]